MELKSYRKSLKTSHPMPLYYRVAYILEHFIIVNGFDSGTDFLSEEDIASQLGTSRPTVSKAIKILLESGRLKRERGKGAVVNIDSKIPIAVLSEHSSFGKSFVDAAQRPFTELLHREIIKPTPKISTLLKLDPDEDVVYLRRLRRLNDVNLVLVESFLSFARYGSIMDLPSQTFSEFDLYGLIETKFGETVVRSEREVTAYRMSMDDASILGLEIWDPCIRTTGIAFAEDGHVVEVFDSRFNGVKCSLKATIYKDNNK